LNEEQLRIEKTRLKEVDGSALVEYIKTSIEILLNLRGDSSTVGHAGGLGA
jgi:hypothetical protein